MRRRKREICSVIPILFRHCSPSFTGTLGWIIHGASHRGASFIDGGQWTSDSGAGQTRSRCSTAPLCFSDIFNGLNVLNQAYPLLGFTVCDVFPSYGELAATLFTSFGIGDGCLILFFLPVPRASRERSL